MADMYCTECKEEYESGNTFCRCGKVLKHRRPKEEIDVQRRTNAKDESTCIGSDADKEEYPTRSVERIGDKVIVDVSKYRIKMEVYEVIIEGREMIVYERALFPSEVDYNLVILRYIVSGDGDRLIGTKYPFPKVGKHITLIDIDDRQLRVRTELDETTWGTLRIFNMERFMNRYHPRPFDPATRTKGDRIRFYIDPTDISQIMIKIIKIDRKTNSKYIV